MTAKSGRQLSWVSGIHGIIKTLPEGGAERGGQMGSCGEAEDADAVRVDVPIGGVGAHDTERALGILQSTEDLGYGPESGTRYLSRTQVMPAQLSQCAHLSAFEVDGQDVVTAARKDNNGHSSVLACGRVEA